MVYLMFRHGFVVTFVKDAGDVRNAHNWGWGATAFNGDYNYDGLIRFLGFMFSAETDLKKVLLSILRYEIGALSSQYRRLDEQIATFSLFAWAFPFVSTDLQISSRCDQAFMFLYEQWFWISNERNDFFFQEIFLSVGQVALFIFKF